MIGDMNTTSTKASKRKSVCNHCRTRITQNTVINAKDFDTYQANYFEEDDATVWLDSEKNAMCYATNFNAAHTTDSEIGE